MSFSIIVAMKSILCRHSIPDVVITLKNSPSLLNHMASYIKLAALTIHKGMVK